MTGFYITKFRCSLGDHFVFLKHIFQKDEQVEKYRVEKERLKRIELLHQQSEILMKNSAKNKYILTYYKIDNVNKNYLSTKSRF